MHYCKVLSVKKNAIMKLCVCVLNVKNVKISINVYIFTHTL